MYYPVIRGLLSSKFNIIDHGFLGAIYHVHMGVCVEQPSEFFIMKAIFESREIVIQEKSKKIVTYTNK